MLDRLQATLTNIRVYCYLQVIVSLDSLRTTFIVQNARPCPSYLKNIEGHGNFFRKFKIKVTVGTNICNLW